jgi:hypothetical protein
VESEGNAPVAYRDVIHEDALKIGEATKAPDYSFRIGGTRKFFVGARKPSVNLDTDPRPAYQLRPPCVIRKPAPKCSHRH